MAGLITASAIGYYSKKSAQDPGDGQEPAGGGGEEDEQRLDVRRRHQPEQPQVPREEHRDKVRIARAGAPRKGRARLLPGPQDQGPVRGRGLHPEQEAAAAEAGQGRKGLRRRVQVQPERGEARLRERLRHRGDGKDGRRDALQGHRQDRDRRDGLLLGPEEVPPHREQHREGDRHGRHRGDGKVHPRLRPGEGGRDVTSPPTTA